ncbi:MAG: hypothetical protein A2735_02145 [Candidatus Yanofskybacteria bacterium RIFCSPHIGHO2_01_FULL_41_21]|uniref:Uncharacterized protein n=1 Tax=Candidatus Yanofskybacteria bacterium RIFCSPHIGHO2_01_FULL_41_21 TaxID=1802660 RepID=A0A1F8E9Q0_9BACT|nr:MAG: hypothetical protein A2735_02145 [Candidatus Yanofskybacteria bacterium RIFCSPHIGHO2_01_FULL_41_21]
MGQAEYGALRRSLIMLILGLIVISSGFAIYLGITLGKLGKAKKTIENYEGRDLRRTQALRAYSLLVMELQKQGLSMNERDDDLASTFPFFLRTKEMRASGIFIVVHVVFFPITVDTELPFLFIAVRFPHEYEDVWGIPALKRKIAETAKNKFPFPDGSLDFHQVLKLKPVGVAGQIGDAVRFYESAITSVQQEFPRLEAQIQEAERTGDELSIRKSDIQNRINSIVASLDDQKETVTS